MCKQGNQSIFKECRDLIFQQSRTDRLPNRVMREILAKHDGCMIKPIDKKGQKVLELVHN